jgi:hypothetical protein
VLQTLDGGSVLIGVGRHRVPAKTSTQLQPGQRYLFEVVGEGEPPELRVLVDAEARAGDGALLRALRSALADEQPLGAMLASLAGLLEQEAQAGGAKDPALQRLLDALAKQLFSPGAGGEQLAERLRAGGQGYEGRWAELVLRAARGSGASDLGALLRTAFLSELGAGGALDTALANALRELFAAQEGGLESSLQRWLSGRERRRPADQAQRAPTARPRPARARTAAGAAARAAALARPRCVAREHATRAGRSAGRRARGTEGLSSPQVAQAAAELGHDLKAELLRARQELEPGRARNAVERALANVEAEQLLNVARSVAHEPLHWSLPVLDGSNWTTAHLYVHRDGGAPHKSGPSAASQRMALSVEFSRTGPVHVDVLVRDSELAVRVLVARDDVAAHLRARLPELEQHLAFGGRAVRTALATAPEAQLRGEDGVRDVGFLRDHHVMDLLG